MIKTFQNGKQWDTVFIAGKQVKKAFINGVPFYEIFIRPNTTAAFNEARFNKARFNLAVKRAR